MAKFIERNEEFTCYQCGREVKPHESSSRDHCPFCLFGLHVDVYPGDRANTCKGKLKPIGVKMSNKKEQIVYKCQNCREYVYCKTAPDDSREVISQLYEKAW
jgi:predicted RNA-binding Zn-ribbon protein involved in translation (DUF1610 family)